MGKRIQVVVSAIVKKGNKYLLTKRFDLGDKRFHEKWQLPGGGLEFAESPLETLAREAREELGVELDNPRLLPEVVVKVDGGWHGVFICYLCTLKDEKESIVLNEEATEYRWVTLVEMEQLPLISEVERVVKIADKL